MSSLLVFIYGIGFIFWLIEALNLGARYYWEALLSLFRGDHQKFTGIAQENRNYVRSSRKKQFEESKGSEGSKRPEKEKSLWVDDYGQYIGEDATLGTVISGNKPKRQKLSWCPVANVPFLHSLSSHKIKSINNKQFIKANLDDSANEWGFGQILAMVLAVPACWKYCVCCCNYIRSHRPALRA